MVRRILFAVFGSIVSTVLGYFLAMQLAYFLSFHYDLIAYSEALKATFICVDPRILFWQGNDKYFGLATFIIIVLAITFLLTTLTPGKNEKAQRRAERMQSREERMEYTHLASVHEAKKGMQRFQFDRTGNCSNVFRNFKGQSLEKTIYMVIGHICICLSVVSLIEIFIHGIDFIVRWFGKSFSCGWMVLSMSAWLKILIFFILIFLCTGVYAGVVQEANRPEGTARQVFTGFHVRDYMDLLFDPHKQLWNTFIVKFKIKDLYKKNTLKYYNIGDQKTCRRSGLPMLTTKRAVWVDNDDSHSLTIGTTNSGKTFGVILGFIEVCRMAGTSMFINDIKSELYRKKSAALIHEGYNVIKVDFTDPESGDCWNPFGEVVKSYRKAQDEADTEMQNRSMNQWMAYQSLKVEQLKQSKVYVGTLKLLLTPNLSRSETQEVMDQIHEEQVKLDELSKRIEEIEDTPWFVKPDFDKENTFEFLEDICRTLCEEKDSKQPFFWQSAQSIMQGCVCFLLEHEYLSEDETEICRLDKDQINFGNIELLSREGFDTGFNGVSLFSYYLGHLRRKLDRSQKYFDKILKQPAETLGNILGTFGLKISLGTLSNRIERMTSRTTFDFDDLINKKTAIFLCVHDEKSTYYPFVTIFVMQLYQALIRNSRKYNGELPIPWDIIWDEFGISPAMKDIDKWFAAARSRHCRFHVVIQDYSQIEQTYGKDGARAIKDNVQDTIYLLGGDNQTLKEISEKAGKKLKWNKEKQSFDTIPVVSVDRLQHFSLSEALILRQRKMPVITRYYNYNWYVYQKFLQKLPKVERPEITKLQPYAVFSLKSDYEKCAAVERKPSEGFGINPSAMRFQRVRTDEKENEEEYDMKKSIIQKIGSGVDDFLKKEKPQKAKMSHSEQCEAELQKLKKEEQKKEVRSDAFKIVNSLFAERDDGNGKQELSNSDACSNTDNNTVSESDSVKNTDK